MGPSSESVQPHRAAFGGRVRQLRAALGLSQEKLADIAGLHRTYVGSLERGERNVSLDQIYRLAKGLNVQVSDLFPVDM
ncbi:helix-turn-helix transcriptional regulator [Nocardia uniformis]|uniref:Helix-turn-helix transcriptional regulator n=1 Tax=Nocardia uniformis TaxID=53432 RepID=A0A849CBS8_9NOCA|nr:helix-turn-helix transcriptional regulator [Nocardia uniformis]NNH73810.1 helix-turn-helix transcriptional regulator [Nocardia uniformis]